MSNERNIWYQTGYALGRVLPGESAPPTKRRKGRAKRGEDASLSPVAEKALGLAAVAGGGVAISAALRLWPARHKPGALNLLKAGAAGAGAAVARMAIRAVLGMNRPDREAHDPLAPIMAGAARGMIYAVVVEPRVPGPVVLRGATYGALEFLAEPWGGLDGLLENVPPHRRIPFLSSVMDARDDDTSLTGQLLFGVVLASLYGQGF